jgi:hypothetical protein
MAWTSKHHSKIFQVFFSILLPSDIEQDPIFDKFCVYGWNSYLGKSGWLVYNNI